MKILITGGKGKVGSFLTSRLPYEILSPGRDELDLFDLKQVSDYLDQHNVDVVIHCALTGRNDLFSQEPHYTTDSLWMFRNLWNNKHKFKKLINLGTAYEFDLSKDNSSVKEDDILSHLPNTSYGYAKNIIARIIKNTDNFYNLRLFGVFHEAEDDSRFFKKLLLNNGIVINNDVFFDYIYLNDILPVILKILNHNLDFRDINMVYPTKYRMSELAYMFADIHDIDKSSISIQGSNNLNVTGDPTRLINFNLMGLQAGIESYKL
jgi:GDP-L-fucose synthase